VRLTFWQRHGFCSPVESQAAAPAVPEVSFPGSIEEAVDELAGLGPDGAALAGATWVMRAPLRREPFRPQYVALRRLDELRHLRPGDPTVIGSLVTHAGVAALDGPLAGLGEAARRSAFPAVRNIATLGGNLCADPFPEADLVPALLALEARVDVASPAGRDSVELEAFLAARPRPDGELVVGVTVPAPSGRRSAFERLTVRSGGEYAVASVAVALDLDTDGVVSAARVAVGVVEPVACRVAAAEAALTGLRVDAEVAEEAGSAVVEGLSARDGVDAPGWYRVAVLPALLRRALLRLTS
jgi:carbon-monoxide dehydrogenase medium subunit